MFYEPDIFFTKRKGTFLMKSAKKQHKDSVIEAGTNYFTHHIFIF